MFGNSSLGLKEPTKKVVWFGLSAFVLLLDQLTKYWASSLDYGEQNIFLPYFNLTLLHNEGAAFSFLADAGGWQRVVLALIASIVSGLLVVWILRLELFKKRELMGLSLILGGALANLWDRISLGYVIDFIDWYYITSSQSCWPFFYFIESSRSCHWPTFNIADAAIFLGAILLIIDMLLETKPKPLTS